MACGVPVVGSSSGGIPEVIGEAGLVVPERDVAALADALGSVLASEARRRELVRLGLARARDVFAWERIADQYRALYDDELERRRGRSASRALTMT